MRKHGFVLIVLVALAVGASSAIGGRSPASNETRLHRFGSCAELLEYMERNALPLVDSWTPHVYPPFGPIPLGAIPSAVISQRSEPPQTAPDYSTTNVQELGVDEPDIVKSNGTHAFAVAQGRLHAVDVRSTRPRLAGWIPLEKGAEHELLLHKNRLLVLSQPRHRVQPLPIALPIAGRAVPPVKETSKTVLTEIDVSDPGAMRVVGTLELEAKYLSSRLVGPTARVVVSSPAAGPRGLEFAKPSTHGAEARAEALARNRAVIESSTPANWLPSYVLKNARTGKSTTRLLQCRQVSRPPAFSGFGMLTVLTIELERGLRPVDSDGVLTDGETVYASPANLYVTTGGSPIAPLPWGSRPPPPKTGLHKFDISHRSRTEYRASGEVAGSLLNQWSLSEHAGLLRVATTESRAGSFRDDTESFVTVLKERSGKLVTIGRVGKLGGGEDIYAVRFIGDVGYVVTFRQTDPLYTIDLSSPTRPLVLGELKIPGYSAYLHAVGEDLLLGIGQDATEDGLTLGTQLSLFDISNLRRPVRLHHKTLRAGSSEVEQDHRAFLYWPATRLAVLPLRAPLAQAVGFRVGRASGLDEVGRISHHGGPDVRSRSDSKLKPRSPAAPIRRSLVVGDVLYTVSQLGVRASDLRALSDKAWIPFP
jgi:Beta propeller domain